MYNQKSTPPYLPTPMVNWNNNFNFGGFHFEKNDNF